VRFTPLSFRTKENTVKPHEIVKTQGEYLIWSSNEEFIGLGLKDFITTKIGINKTTYLNTKSQEIEITADTFTGGEKQ
jgi:hypothetical protein